MTGLMQLADAAAPSRSGVLARSGPMVNRARIAVEAGLLTLLPGEWVWPAGPYCPCIEAGEADEHSWDPLFVVLDGYRDFFGALRSWYARTKGKGAPTAAPVLEALGSLVRKGRTASVHFIIGTQRPDSDFFGGEMRDNFHARISLGALSPQAGLPQMVSTRFGQ